MADRNDAADERQNQPRRGLEGKGYDAGTGYGGAGNDSAYNAQSSYGGQSGDGGNTLGGAYQDERYGRAAEGQGDGGAGDAAGSPEGGNVARDTDGRGSANTARGGTGDDPNVEAVTQAFNDAGDVNPSGVSRDGPDAVDLEDMSGATRREPGR